MQYSICSISNYFAQDQNIFEVTSCEALVNSTTLKKVQKKVREKYNIC